jgi:hypothetical protein
MLAIPRTSSIMSWHFRTPCWIAAFVVVTVLRVARAEAAEVQRVPLQWNAPPGCPNAAAVLADIERNLSASGEEPTAFVAGVDVSELPGGLWQAHLEVEARGGRTERRFEAESCQAIASATAIIIALAADVGEGGQTGDMERPPLSPEQAECRPASDEQHWQRSSLSLMASGLIDGGIAPKLPAVGLELAAGPSWTASLWRLRVLGSAGFLFPRSADVSPAYGDFWRLTVAGRGCLSTGAQFEIGLCVGGELSVMHSKGPTSSGLADETHIWFAPAASAIVSWNVHPRLTLMARGDVSVPVPHPDFHADNGDVVYTVPAVGGGGALGMELHFQ